MDHLRAIDPLAADWTVVVLLLVLGMLAWVNMVSPKQWNVLWRSFFSLRIGKQQLRDELDLQDRTLIGLLVMATLVIALFIHQVLAYNGWMEVGIGGYGWILLWMALALLVQILLLRGLEGLAGTEGGLVEYVYTVVVFQIMVALLLLPLITLMAYPYRPEWRMVLWKVGLAVIAGGILFRWIRAVFIGVGSGVSLRYIFIYLCAAEILPLALVLEQARQLVHQMSHSL